MPIAENGYFSSIPWNELVIEELIHGLSMSKDPEQGKDDGSVI